MFQINITTSQTAFIFLNPHPIPAKYRDILFGKNPVNLACKWIFPVQDAPLCFNIFALIVFVKQKTIDCCTAIPYISQNHKETGQSIPVYSVYHGLTVVSAGRRQPKRVVRMPGTNVL
jgi:hypothetical protein